VSDKSGWEGRSQQFRDSRWCRQGPVPSPWTQPKKNRALEPLKGSIVWGCWELKRKFPMAPRNLTYDMDAPLTMLLTSTARSVSLLSCVPRERGPACDCQSWFLGFRNLIGYGEGVPPSRGQRRSVLPSQHCRSSLAFKRLRHIDAKTCDFTHSYVEEDRDETFEMCRVTYRDFGFSWVRRRVSSTAARPEQPTRLVSPTWEFR
jgi:hypothetical protein